MLQLFKFKGGVKPATHKTPSVQLPIGQAPLPPLLVVALHQSIGRRQREMTEVIDVPVDAGTVRVAAVLTGAPYTDSELQDRAEMIADIRSLIARAKEAGGTFDLPPDLEAQDTPTLEALQEGLLNALEAHAATREHGLI